MKKIIVAGAGHGGLVAAYHLAKAGFSVTVLEGKKRETMGHDWHDWLDMSAFDGADLPQPPAELVYKAEDQSFRNPKGNVEIIMPHREDSIMMDRKELIAYLLSLAEEAGVTLQFETELIAPHTEGCAVKGVIVRRKGHLSLVKADLVIDSAGMYSPLRSKLPALFGVDNEINKRSIFHVYRAYFKNLDGTVKTPSYSINAFHMYRPGIDWVITKPDYVDILIGKFSQSGILSREEVDAALESFRESYPFIGEEIVRGGSFEDIPITRMLPLLVADGYAAIGDAAGMTVPLNGSGIILSMNAGKILADTVMAADGEYTREKLWSYEYHYFTKLGKDLVMIDIIKTVFTYINGDVVDYLMEKGILNADMLAIPDGKTPNITADYVKRLITSLPKFVKHVPALSKCMKTLPLLPGVCKSIPEKYDETKVNKWIKAYKAL